MTANAVARLLGDYAGKEVMTLRERLYDQPPTKIQALRQRISSLYQQGAVQAQSNVLLSTAFEEITHLLEELQAAHQMLHRQRDESLNTQAAQELEIQRYKDLFEHAPTGYLVTSIDGALRQANTTALALLETSERAMVGRSLAFFVPEGQRRALHTQIAQVLQVATPQEWVMHMCSWEGTPFAARLTVRVLRGPSGKPLALYWLMRALDERSAPE